MQLEGGFTKGAVRRSHEGCSWKSLALRGEAGGLMTSVVGGVLEGVQLVFQVVKVSKHVILPLADIFIQAATL